MPPRAADRKPIIWAFSLSKLNGLLESVIPDYRADADVRVFHLGFDEALNTARALIASGEEVDVFVSAGSNGAYLRARAPVPVVVIAPTGFDMLAALSRARKLSSRVGLVTYGAVTPELEQFKDLYDLEIAQRAYVTEEDARAAVDALRASGVEVVVGPGLVCDLAEAAGLPGVFLYSQSSVRDALARAVEIARIGRTEEARRQRLDAILRHLRDGVVAVDAEERIESVNPAMEAILGARAEKVIGARLSSIAPGLALTRVLESGAPELEGIQRLGKRTLVTNRIPFVEQGRQTGAVLTCQDATAISRVDRSLRSHDRPRRFVARYELADIVGVSAEIRRARSLAATYARTDATVLVTGASGTGKELFAQGIHNASPRRSHPFVAVNCAAFPETLLESELFGYEEGAFTGSRRGGRAGLFEAAHAGTIFLDEIGEIPLPLQTRLLRVLQEREVLRLGANETTPVDVRVVAATNRDLEQCVANGTFRADLYYRLDILHLHLPPLAARPEDVRAIAAHLLDDALRRHGAPGLRERAAAALLPLVARAPWPGNVRQLENVLERAAVLCAASDGGAGLEDDLRALVPSASPPPGSSPVLSSAVEDGERALIERAVRECNGNQSEAARRLGIGRTTLWRKLRERRARPSPGSV
ncbi:MAG TPA: propionate catabolism operon regulatory protein PrpR [Anaeromyxobacteraceae bacterium]|nr:propionate catabolism operon regulatory protein PrpR [Anaeromyxobacteraceae bacterium]